MRYSHSSIAAYMAFVHAPMHPSSLKSSRSQELLYYSIVHMLPSQA